MPTHASLAGNELHALQYYSFADRSARTAVTLTSADLGRVAYEQSSGTYWVVGGAGTEYIWLPLSTMQTAYVSSDIVVSSASSLAELTLAMLPTAGRVYSFEHTIIVTTQATNVEVRLAISGIPGAGGYKRWQLLGVDTQTATPTSQPGPNDTTPVVAIPAGPAATSVVKTFGIIKPTGVFGVIGITAFVSGGNAVVAAGSSVKLDCLGAF